MENCKDDTKKKQYRKNKCVVCGKEFKAVGNCKYCSPECKSHQGERNMHTIICKNCGKEVTAYKNAKFCSDECRIYYKNRQAALRKQERRNESLVGAEDVDYVICKICGMKVKQLGDAHFKVFHKSSLSEYKKLYPDAKITSQAFLDEHLIGSNNPSSKEKTTEQERKERSPFSTEFYKKKGINDDTTRKEFIDNVAANRDYTTRLNYYINKGFTEKEAEKMLHDRQVTFTLEKCIMKYGEEEGRRRFEERQKNWAAKMREKYENGEYSKVPYKLISNMYSIFEIGCIDKIIKNMSETIENCDIEDFVKQFEIFVKGLHRRFIYDLKYKNKIIEFNGDYWHCNPEIYDADYFNTQLQLTAKEKWEVDKVKEDIASLNGYKVLVIWESEYKKDPDATIRKCVSFLTS